MRVPLSWLKEYVEITLPPEALAEKMTLAGLEVGSIEYYNVPADRPAWDPELIVVCEVLDVQRHPNADRLVLATVDHGVGEPMQVVTGAPNLKVGDKGVKAPFARRGAQLYDGHQEGWVLTTLKPSKIRGVRSEAMICSEKELGLLDYHEQVIVLPKDAPVGMPLAEYMDMDAVAPSDVVLDLDLTPNLARCYSMIGVAREVAALTGQKLKLNTPTMSASGPAIEGQIELEIDDPDLCRRYSATLIKGVEIGPSPYWMQRRLTLAGMRPISNIVDITNYVMWEWGQPLHAFDYRMVRPRPGTDGPPTIIVRRAKPGETMTTLDGQLRRFTPDMLLITDGGGPVGIAGVMGGLDSEITSKTTDILLEAANFNNINNRRTSQALKLPSEASTRFGKGVPAELTIPAATRATELMRLHAGGEIAAGIADLYPTPQPKRVVHVTSQEVKRQVGIDVSAAEIVEMLKSLDFTCKLNGDEVEATVPMHRLDVEITADLVEEVARMYGYDRIPLTLMTDELPPQRRNRVLEGEEKIRDVLVGCGLDEVITYRLTGKKTIEALDLAQAEMDESQYLKLSNPLTSDRVYMRRTMLGSLLETMRDNYRFLDRIAIFEVGRVYWPTPPSDPLVRGKDVGRVPIPADTQVPTEPRRLSIGMGGPRDERVFQGDAGMMDFYDLKGAVETLLSRLGIDDVAYVPVQPASFHPGRTAQLMVSGQPAGVMGEIHPSIRERFDLPQMPILAAELDLDVILGAASDDRIMNPISRFPSVSQDIALVVDEDVPAGNLRAAILDAGGDLLADVVLFDLYLGEQVGAGKKSLAYALTYRAMDRTLTDEEVNQVQSKIVEAMKAQFGAELRG